MHGTQKSTFLTIMGSLQRRQYKNSQMEEMHRVSLGEGHGPSRPSLHTPPSQHLHGLSNQKALGILSFRGFLWRACSSWGRKEIPWRKKWQPTPYSCLENPMDRGAWRASPRGRKEPNTTGRLTLSDLDVHLGQRPVQGPPSGGIWRIKGGRDEGVNYRR